MGLSRSFCFRSLVLYSSLIQLNSFMLINNFLFNYFIFLSCPSLVQFVQATTYCIFWFIIFWSCRDQSTWMTMFFKHSQSLYVPTLCWQSSCWGSATHREKLTIKDGLCKTFLLMSLFDDFYISFLNNSSKLCTKRFGQQQPVLCWISHINSSQWRHTQLQDFKTSERSWTGDHDTKWWWLMFSIALPVFFPSKAHDTVGPPEEKTKSKLISEIKTREKNSDTTRVLGQTHIKVQEHSK